MIKLIRINNMAIDMYCDLEGVQFLHNVFKQILKEKNTIAISLLFEWAIINLKKENITEKVVMIEYRNESKSRLIVNERIVTWYIGQDDLESAIYNCETCIRLGYFVPAEFIRVQVLKNKKYDYIHSEVMSKGLSWRWFEPLCLLQRQSSYVL